MTKVSEVGSSTNYHANTKAHSELAPQSEAPSVDRYIRSIKFKFDERSLANLEPLGSKHGIVQVIYIDGTGNAKGCTRDTLGSTIAELIDAKINRLIVETVLIELHRLYDNRNLITPEIGTSIFMVKANDIKERIIELTEQLGEK